MSHGSDPYDLASLIVAHDDPHVFDAVVPPIVQTSLFTFSSYEEMLATYQGEKVRPVYTRGLNPTVRLFEEMLAKLEGAEDALGFASGMAAISAAVLSFVEPGDRIIAVRHVYPDAFRLFGSLLKRFKIEVTYVDGRDETAIDKALPGAKLLYLESPTSWVMEAHDVGALAQLARRHGAISVIDNSWSSPIFQKPLSLGVDIILHSASKYLGGHSDVVSGVVAGSKAMIDRLRAEAYPYLGGKMSPFDAWLLIRGLPTGRFCRQGGRCGSACRKTGCMSSIGMGCGFKRKRFWWVRGAALARFLILEEETRYRRCEIWGRRSECRPYDPLTDQKLSASRSISNISRKSTMYSMIR